MKYLSKDDVFITKKITNSDIYNELRSIKKDIHDLKEESNDAHDKLEKHQIRTNGKVLLNRWIAGTALTAVGGVAAWLFMLK